MTDMGKYEKYVIQVERIATSVSCVHPAVLDEAISLLLLCSVSCLFRCIRQNIPSSIRRILDPRKCSWLEKMSTGTHLTHSPRWDPPVGPTFY